MDLSCNSVTFAMLVGVRVGLCTDRDGNTYSDLGASMGPQAGFVLSTQIGVTFVKPGTSFDVRAFGIDGIGFDVGTTGAALAVGGGAGLSVGFRDISRIGVRTRPSR
jgi:hypothetical protein